MSRIGKNPVAIPAGVTVEVAEGVVTVKGKLGQLTQEFSDVTVKIEEGQVVVERSTDHKDHRAKHGLYRSLINNMIIGVSTGYRGGTLQSLHVSEFGKICKKITGPLASKPKPIDKATKVQPFNSAPLTTSTKPNIANNTKLVSKISNMVEVANKVHSKLAIKIQGASKATLT